MFRSLFVLVWRCPLLWMNLCVEGAALHGRQDAPALITCIKSPHGNSRVQASSQRFRTRDTWQNNPPWLPATLSCWIATSVHLTAGARALKGRHVSRGHVSRVSCSVCVLRISYIAAVRHSLGLHSLGLSTRRKHSDVFGREEDVARCLLDSLALGVGRSLRTKWPLNRFKVYMPCWLCDRIGYPIFWFMWSLRVWEPALHFPSYLLASPAHHRHSGSQYSEAKGLRAASFSLGQIWKIAAMGARRGTCRHTFHTGSVFAQ